MLSHKNIEEAIQTGAIKLSSGYKIQPCSIDFEVEYAENVLEPGQATTAKTTAVVELNKEFAGLLIPRSRTFRNGALTQGGSLVDPGYRGRLVVTLLNVGRERINLALHPSPVQMVLFKLNSATLVPYGDASWDSNWMDS